MKAGVMEGGEVRETLLGSPQGGVISPLLANIYLHYVFDLWTHQWRGRHARGDVMIVRYADDSVLGFESKADVDRFLEDLKGRFAQFGLTLNEDKTRVLQFGRFAAQARAKQGASKAADVRLPWVHPHLWEIPVERLVPTEAADLGEANACPTQGDSTGADAPHARADPRGRPLAAARSPGVLQLPRRTGQC